MVSRDQGLKEASWGWKEFNREDLLSIRGQGSLQRSDLRAGT